jgi:hypothetical protein
MFQHPALARTRALSALRHDAPTVEIRLADAGDAPSLMRLAQLDSALAAAAELPGLAARDEVLVAEIDDEIVAALSLPDGLIAADPFRRTDALIALLHVRREQLARRRRRPRGGRAGVLRARHS